MNSQVIIAVGVDIGTTTTQMIISRLTLENTGGYGMAPKIEITKKEILHQSEIYFTPLKSGGEIDGAEAVKKSYPNFWDEMKSLGMNIEILAEK